MLKINSEEVRQAVRAWILEHVTIYNEAGEVIEAASFEDAAAYVWSTFKVEQSYLLKYPHSCTISAGQAFAEWLQGLPCGRLGTFYLGGAAHDFLGDALKQTAEERAKYNYNDSEAVMAQLIFKEVTKAVNF